jgi:hypothetical protein
MIGLPVGTQACLVANITNMLCCFSGMAAKV